MLRTFYSQPNQVAARNESSVASNAGCIADGSGSSGGHISSLVACELGRYFPDVVGLWRHCVRFGWFSDFAVGSEAGFSMGQRPRRGAAQEPSPTCKEWMSFMKRSLYDRIGGRAGIATLLRHFYADVRQHAFIGPIFNQRISDWPAHLAKTEEFWARVTGGPSVYSGQMPAKHFPLGLDASHLAAWLQLWDSNCRCYLRPEEAQEMSHVAHEIGRRLRSILARRPTAWTVAFATLWRPRVNPCYRAERRLAGTVDRLRTGGCGCVEDDLGTCPALICAMRPPSFSQRSIARRWSVRRDFDSAFTLRSLVYIISGRIGLRLCSCTLAPISQPFNQQREAFMVLFRPRDLW